MEIAPPTNGHKKKVLNLVHNFNELSNTKVRFLNFGVLFKMNIKKKVEEH